MGRGLNLVTGDYSRGAGGYWVENGEIQFPVQEVTIAGNLRDMFRQIVAIGCDIGDARQRADRLGADRANDGGREVSGRVWRARCEHARMSGRLFAFFEVVVNQRHEGVEGFFFLLAIGMQMHRSALAGGQHHDGHDALAIDQRGGQRPTRILQGKRLATATNGAALLRRQTC